MLSRWLVLAAALCCGSMSAHGDEWFVYDVRPGDTLWDVSAEFLGDAEYWTTLRRFNKVPDPYHLEPGSQIRIPMDWVKSRSVSATVAAVQGRAVVKSPADSSEKVLRVDDEIFQGEQVCVAPDSNVTLSFADASTLLLQADSCLVLDKAVLLGYSGRISGVRTILENGKTENRTSPQRDPSSRFEIRTPSVSVSVRGTEYRVGTLEDSQGSRVEVLSSNVAVTGRQQRATRIKAGYGAVASAEGTLSPPVKLLPPPDLSGIPAVAERVPIRISIPELPGAATYRLQIAQDASFLSLVSDRTSASSVLQGLDIPDGEYVIRARGIDTKGLEGNNAERRLTLNARPEPPFLQNPAADTAVPVAQPTFEWTESLEAQHYAFQLSDSADFDQPLVDVPKLEAHSYAVEQPLAPGVYRWRVRVIAKNGEIGPFSDAQPFRVIIAPKVDEPEIGSDSMTFRWRAGDPGQRYRVQIAKDEKFAEMLVEQEVAEPQLVIPRPPHGDYYLRAATIETDGTVGPFGSTQKFEVPGGFRWYYLLPLFTLFAI